jgi:pyrroloquinoline quinone biosynthesis protein B|tara:strand:+ start:215 stop:1042 length:828 start_codon:yes stop_codon:yes gene_type:complete
MYNKITLLGNAQDAGRPHIGCIQHCCEDARKDFSLVRNPVSLGLHGEKFGIVEITKNITNQLGMVNNPNLSEIWLTHAHLGHIEGLGQLGKEALNSKNIKLRCSESVVDYVMKHPIWKKLVVRGNITFAKFFSDNIVPIKVPHRAKDFDTHALLFKGKNNNLLFLPDHDSWEETLEFVGYDNPKDWFISLNVDVVLLDGTFWNTDELKNRVQARVPHPPVSETIDLLGSRNEGDPRIIFIHLNHTNPLHYPDSEEYLKVENMGWEIGHEGMEFDL